MARKKLKCPIWECQYEAMAMFEFEEIPMPNGMQMSELKREPPIGVVARNYRLHCPEHGPKIAQVFGHHITHIPKKSKRKS